MTTNVPRLFEDRRIAGIPRYYVATEPDRMQVPDLIRKCVVFVCAREGGPPGGTAFLLSAPVADGHDGHSEEYVVTARHVIEDAVRSALRLSKAERPYLSWDEIATQKVYLRFNVVGGGPRDLGVPVSAWVCHADDGVDVAVARLPRLPGLDHGFYKIEQCAFPEVIRQKGIGLGDGVFIVGLFKEHAGKERNNPIVRVGNIAAMPEEKVAWDGGRREMEAYLIEARSIGGVSGSPVFAVIDPVRLADPNEKWCPDRGRKEELVIGFPEFHLIGLVNGHWDSDDYGPRGINSGIAIVVPIERAREVIDAEPLKSRREARAAKIRASNSPVTD